jgi:hypothetical protein
LRVFVSALCFQSRSSFHRQLLSTVFLSLFS